MIVQKVKRRRHGHPRGAQVKGMYSLCQEGHDSCIRSHAMIFWEKLIFRRSAAFLKERCLRTNVLRHDIEE